MGCPVKTYGLAREGTTQKAANLPILMGLHHL